MTPRERAEKWIHDSGDDTDELQEAAAIMQGLMAEYSMSAKSWHQSTGIFLDERARLQGRITGLEAANRDLTARIAEYEKPGLAGSDDWK